MIGKAGHHVGCECIECQDIRNGTRHYQGPPTEPERMAKAAAIMADLFSATVLGGALREKPPRTFLYIWEREALAWLKEWRQTGGDGGINAWTASYMRHGPPPWPKEDWNLMRGQRG